VERRIISICNVFLQGINCTVAPPDKTSLGFQAQTFNAATPPGVNTAVTYTCKSGYYFDFDRTNTSLQVTCLENNVYTDPAGGWPTCLQDVNCGTPPISNDPDVIWNYDPTKKYNFTTVFE
jgi:hypothetical protein